VAELGPPPCREFCAVVRRDIQHQRFHLRILYALIFKPFVRSDTCGRYIFGVGRWGVPCHRLPDVFTDNFFSHVGSSCWGVVFIRRCYRAARAPAVMPTRDVAAVWALSAPFWFQGIRCRSFHGFLYRHRNIREARVSCHYWLFIFSIKTFRFS